MTVLMGMLFGALMGLMLATLWVIHDHIVASTKRLEAMGQPQPSQAQRPAPPQYAGTIAGGYGPHDSRDHDPWLDDGEELYELPDPDDYTLWPQRRTVVTVSRPARPQLTVSQPPARRR